jgi:hypothetical protein
MSQKALEKAPGFLLTKSMKLIKIEYTEYEKDHTNAVAVASVTTKYCASPITT